MRTNTLSINRNSRNDTNSTSFRIKKVARCLCLLGALVIAGFSATSAQASCQGASKAKCDADNANTVETNIAQCNGDGICDAVQWVAYFIQKGKCALSPCP